MYHGIEERVWGTRIGIIREKSGNSSGSIVGIPMSFIAARQLFDEGFLTIETYTCSSEFVIHSSRNKFKTLCLIFFTELIL